MSLRSELQNMPRTAWVIFSGMFVNKFGNFLNVFLVLYLTSRGFSPLAAGAALTVVGLGNFVGNALGGLLADHVGRRGTIVVSMFGSGIATLIVPLLDHIVAIVVAVGVVGVFAQLFRPAAGALLVDSVRPEQRLTAFAVYRLALNVGMSVGPAVGGFLSQRSYAWMFVGDAVTSMVYGLLALFLIKETGPVRAPTGGGEADSVGYGVVLRDLRYLAYLAAMVAATYVYIQPTATLPLHVHGLGLSNETFGLLLGFNAALVILFEIPLTRLTGRYQPLPVIAVGLVILAAGVGATGLTGSAAAIAVTVAVWTLAEMVYTPVANAYPGMVAPEQARGRYQGAEGLAHTLGATLGPAIGGALFAVRPAINWIVCAVVAVLGAGLSLLARVPPAAAAPVTTDAVVESPATDLPAERTDEVGGPVGELGERTSMRFGNSGTDPSPLADRPSRGAQA